MRSQFRLELWLHTVVSSLQNWGCGLVTGLGKNSRSLIFAVRRQSAKTAKIMRLENLALYGISLATARASRSDSLAYCYTDN